MNYKNTTQLFLKIAMLLFAITLSVSCVKEEIASDQKDNFVKFFGGTYTGEGVQAQQLEDGSYILLGNTSSKDTLGNDIFIAKADMYGNELWSKRIGGKLEEKAYGMVLMSDGGLVIVGSTINDAIAGNSTTNVYLIRTNSDGDTLWTRKIGGALSIIGNSIQQKKDGGFVIGGTITYTDNTDAAFITTDSQGLNVKIRVQNIDGNQSIKYIVEKNDSFLLIGSNASSLDVKGASDIYLQLAGPVRVNSSINIGNSGSDFGKKIKEFGDGSFAGIATIASLKDSGNNFCLFKFRKSDDSIQIQWMKNYGNLSSNDVTGLEVTENGFALVGTSTITDGTTDILFVTTDKDGKELTKRTIGGLGNQRATDISKTSDGGYLIIGNNEYAGNSAIMLIKTK